MLVVEALDLPNSSADEDVFASAAMGAGAGAEVGVALSLDSIT
jgi:hypothetical protein